jgi:hypothetical protein
MRRPRLRGAADHDRGPGASESARQHRGWARRALVESAPDGVAQPTKTVEQGVPSAGERMATRSQGLKSQEKPGTCRFVSMVLTYYRRMHIKRSALINVSLQ